MQKNIYSSASRIRNPMELLRAMKNDLLASGQLSIQLCLRDIKAQYRQTIFGIVWLFVPPLVMAITLSLANEARVINFGETAVPYLAYVMIGMFVWQTFTESLEAPVKAIEGSRTVLVKINFPRESLIIARIIQTMINFSIRFVFILAVLVYYSIALAPGLLFLPLVIFNLVLLGIAAGLLISIFAVLYHDFSKALMILAGAWFVLAPVVYPLPDSGGLFATVVRLNPVTTYLEAVRSLISAGQISNMDNFLLVSGGTYIAVLCVWVLFRLAIPYIIERMSA